MVAIRTSRSHNCFPQPQTSQKHTSLSPSLIAASFVSQDSCRTPHSCFPAPTSVGSTMPQLSLGLVMSFQSHLRTSHSLLFTRLHSTSRVSRLLGSTACFWAAGSRGWLVGVSEGMGSEVVALERPEAEEVSSARSHSSRRMRSQVAVVPMEMAKMGSAILERGWGLVGLRECGLRWWLGDSLGYEVSWGCHGCFGGMRARLRRGVTEETAL